jgi:hypothetical protein
MIAPALDIIQSQITSPDPKVALRAAAILIRHAAPRSATLMPHPNDADPVKALLEEFEDLDETAYPLEDHDDDAPDDGAQDVRS